MFRLPFCLVLLGCTLGCVHFPSESDRRKSSEPYGAVQIEGQPLRDYIRGKFGYIIGGKAVVDAPSDADQANQVRLRLEFAPGREGGIGTAAAIDSRGYFLTAAHNIRGDTQTLFFFDGTNSHAESFRVVWNGKIKGNGADLALIVVPVALQKTWRWSARFTQGDAVIGVGPADAAALKLDPVIFAGIIKSSFQSRSSPEIWSIVHDAPIRRGDSGGPLFDLSGHLVAIEIELDWSASIFKPWSLLKPSQEAQALRPDLKWLNQLIEADLAEKRRTPLR